MKKIQAIPKGLIVCLCLALLGCAIALIINLSAGPDHAQYLLPNAKAQRPNILFIAIDDLRPELGCYGSEMAITPNIDKLASTGLLFERAYCNVPICGASRASLFTGMYPVGQDRFLGYDTRVDQDAPDAVTLGQAFKRAGYTTLSNGKVLHFRRDAQDRSWSEPAWRPKVSPLEPVLPETGAIRSERGNGYIVESADVHDDKYYDGMVAFRTVKDLHRLKDAGEPFFLACGFFNPHLPFYAPKRYWDLYDREQLPLAENREPPINAPPGLTGSREWRHYYNGDLEYNSPNWHRLMRHGYLASISYVDACVGRVLDALEELGLAENTIVVIWGDHGWHLGENSYWSKHNTLEKSARVPLIIHVPQGVMKTDATGKKTAAMVESVDIYPTLCELAGIKTPDTVQGRSMAKLLENPDTAFRDSIYWRLKTGDTVLTDRYAYTRYESPEDGRMLFDHKSDPGENRNVVNEPAYQDTAALIDKLLQSRIDAAAGR